MCRNIKTLANFAPPATPDEIRASGSAVREETERIESSIPRERSRLQPRASMK